jgi:hypothetical protein
LNNSENNKQETGIRTKIRKYGRFALGMYRFFRHTLTLEEAKAIIRKRMAERESNFLRLIEKGVFGYPRSPYGPLLKLAGCEMDDIRTMVRMEGLEKTLQALRDAGVYVTFEEFKGRRPIEREGRVWPVEPQDFDNPYLSKSFTSRTGGSTGLPTRVSTDLDHVAAQAPHLMVAWDAHGVLGLPTGLWRGTLPDDSSGIHNILFAARFGHVTEKWFSHIEPAWDASLKDRMTTPGIVLLARLFGGSVPWPQVMPLDQAAIVARWMTGTVKTRGACLLLTQVSRALRVCYEAEKEGLDLTGATFAIGGEPPTPAKVRRIIETGADYFPTYHFAEAGRIGMGCSHPDGCNDLHLLKDAFALIQRQRPVPGTDITVPAFQYTSLLLTAPKILLNTESDDYGILERSSCGCPLEECGFTDHLRHIYSFSKITGEGVTLVGSDLVRILEEVLPERFGGGPLDYQLVEEEDEKHFTRLSLYVNPSIAIEDERQVIEAMLSAVANTSKGVPPGILKRAGTIQIKRSNPIWTSRGKLMPLHLAGRSREYLQ